MVTFNLVSMLNLRSKNIPTLSLIFLSVTLAVFGQLFLKNGVGKIGALSVADFLTSRIFSVVTESSIAIGILLYGVASALWIVALSQKEVSSVYPLIALGYAVTAISAKFLFNENLSLFRMVGIILIVAGAYLIILKI